MRTRIASRAWHQWDRPTWRGRRRITVAWLFIASMVMLIASLLIFSPGDPPRHLQPAHRPALNPGDDAPI